RSRESLEEVATSVRPAPDLDDRPLAKDRVVARVGIHLEVAAIVPEELHGTVPSAARGEVEHDLLAVADVGPQEAPAAAVRVAAILHQDSGVVAVDDEGLEDRGLDRGDDREQQFRGILDPVAEGRLGEEHAEALEDSTQPVER